MPPRSRIGRKLWLIIRGAPPRGKYTVARRVLQIVVLTLFTTQLLVSGAIIEGSLASSRVLQTIPMMDIFAWLEQTAATRSPTLESITAVLVVFALYSVLGRFFCGWVCPMDLMFSIFEKKLNLPRDFLQMRFHKPTRAEKVVPLVVLIAYLILSYVFALPFFTTTSPVAGMTKFSEFQKQRPKVECIPRQ